MDKSGIMWGLMLILFGGLILLNRMGILPGNVWTIFWPLALILWGLSLLVGGFGRNRRRQTPETRQLAFQLKGYEAAEVAVHFSAGRLTLDSGAAPDELLAGTFAGGVAHELQPDGEVARVTLRTPPDWRDQTELDWDIALNDDIPTAIELHTGAADSLIDLERTHVTRVSLNVGAGKAEIVLPAAAGQTDVRVTGGAGSLTIRVPDGVAAHIEESSTVGRVEIDEDRFPRNGAAYRSADYDSAANRADVRVRLAAGKVRIV